MTSYPCHSPQVVIISGGRRSKTSWSWATRLEPALLVSPGGSVDPTWVAMKFIGHLSLGYTTIIQGVDGSYVLSWTNSALCPYSKYRNTGIAFTIAVGINEPSADAHSAMAGVWASIPTPQKPYWIFKFSQESTRLYYKQAKYLFQSYIAIM